MTQKITDLKKIGELITTQRANGSRRVQIDVSEPVMTDQSMAKATDINNILKQYANQGINPHQPIDPSLFRDNTNIPDPITAFDIVNRSIELFSQVPADIRKLMDNDPSKLEEFLLDKDNEELLIRRGVLAAKPTPASVEPIKELKPDAATQETKS